MNDYNAGMDVQMISMNSRRPTDAGQVDSDVQARPASAGRRLFFTPLICTLFVVLSLGCVERRLMISSEPAGALVYLNDQEVGRTPLEVPFTWYGTYDVRLEREGYQTLQTQQVAERPWWEAPGPDLIAEAMPDKQVQIAWHLKMTPAQPASEADPQRVLDFAKQLRELNRRD